MDFTLSNAYATDGGTGHRLHQDSAPITTVWSAADANMVIWSLMKLLADAGISAATFDPTNVATYNRVSLAVQAFGAGTSPDSETVALPGGKLLKYGRYTSDVTGDEGTASITFAHAFSTTPVVMVCDRNPSGDASADATIQVKTESTTGFTVAVEYTPVTGGGSTAVVHGFNWMAIGS